MNLYLISQTINNGYNTYDSAVVCAENEEEARMTHPDGRKDWDGEMDYWDDWCDAKDVKVKLIGTSVEGVERGVVCASFNAA